MRDGIIDRVVQPAVDRLGIPVAATAAGLARLQGALALASAAWTFDIYQSSLAGSLLQVILCMGLVTVLLTVADMGSSILSGPLGTVHMIARTSFLGLSVCAFWQTGIGLLLGVIGPTRGLMADIGMDASMLCLAGSLYVGVCDDPPADRRRVRTRPSGRSSGG